MTEPNKLDIYGNFAECYTRQKGYLSSAMRNTLGKEATWQKSMRFGPKMAIFTEYQCDTRQRGQNLGLEWSVFAECPRVTLGKEVMFAECQVLDTRQTKACLPSVRAWTLGKRAVTVFAPSR